MPPLLSFFLITEDSQILHPQTCLNMGSYEFLSKSRLAENYRDFHCHQMLFYDFLALKEKNKNKKKMCFPNYIGIYDIFNSRSEVNH